MTSLVCFYESYHERWSFECDAEAQSAALLHETRGPDGEWCPASRLPASLDSIRRIERETRPTPEPQLQHLGVTEDDDPAIHTGHTDCLDDAHPWAYAPVWCGRCKEMVHASNNELMREWVEWNGKALCWDCFVSTTGAPGPEAFAQVTQGPEAGVQ